MKNYNKNIKQKSAHLFLGIFISFLISAFFHTHHFNLVYGEDINIENENRSNYIDLLLDSSLNCTISTFNKTINHEASDFIDEISLEKKGRLNYSIPFYHPNNSKSSNSLRAPPQNLV